MLCDKCPRTADVASEAFFRGNGVRLATQGSRIWPCFERAQIVQEDIDDYVGLHESGRFVIKSGVDYKIEYASIIQIYILKLFLFLNTILIVL